MTVDINITNPYRLCISPEDQVQAQALRVFIEGFRHGNSYIRIDINTGDGPRDVTSRLGSYSKEVIVQ